MSTRRLIASFTVSAAALAIAATFAVRSFPLEAQGKAPADNGEPIQLVRGGENLLHGELPEYPGRAIKNKVEVLSVAEVIGEAIHRIHHNESVSELFRNGGPGRALSE